MAKLRVKNVGPIRNGLDSHNGFIDFNSITVFIGNQGSGKSTIAKLFSTLSWVEKALVRKDFTDDYITKYNRFQKKYLAYQNIHNYLSEKSEIQYIGDAYNLTYKDEQLIVTKSNEANYSFPKIMYVPAERNLVSSIDRLDKVKNLPAPLYTFFDEYSDAKSEFNNGLELPILNSKVLFNKQGTPKLIGDDYQINLVEASSGFHSLVPLILVTQYLSRIVKNELNKSKKEFSREEEIKLRNAVHQLLGKKDISEELIQIALKQISSRFTYKSFINIIEEPEQNLFPESQGEVLYSILKYHNEDLNNKLVLTTHSPYIINYLTLAIKANKIFSNLNTQAQNQTISKIVPLESAIEGAKVSIYELNETNGSVKPIKKYKDLPSDENYLNNSLEKFNNDFIKLIQAENNVN